MKKLLKYGAISLIVIFLFLLMTPWLFKDEIFKKIKSEANKNLKGQLEIRDLSLSLIRDFPNLTLSLSDVVYTGEAPFEGVELLNINLFRAELDLMSVIRGNEIRIREIYLRNPTFDVRVLEDGTANYLIMKEEEETEEDSAEEPSPFQISLKRLKIDNLNLKYDDAEGHIFSEIIESDIVLKGDFTQDITDIDLTTTAKSLTVGYEGINYLSKVVLQSKIGATYNSLEEKLTLRNNEVYLNKLQLLFDGWMQMFEDKMAIHLKFDAPKADFKEFLSLIPAVYMQDFDGVKASGKFALNGTVAGDYFYEGESLPAFDLKFLVENGKVQYPDLPSSLDKIDIAMSITHPQGIDDLTIINMQKGNLSVAGSPFESKLYLTNPVSDPNIDFTIKTNLDLKKLLDAVPVEGTKMSGILLADARIKGRLSAFENEEFGNVVAEGFFSAGKMKISYEDLSSPIEIDTVYTAITPQKFDLPILRMNLGKSDFAGSGSLTNMLGYVLSDDTLKGSFTLSSKFMDVNELMNMMASDSSTTAATTEAPLTAPEVPANLNLTIAAKASQVLYDDLNLTNMAGVLQVANSVVRLSDFTMDLLEGKILMNGAYAVNNGIPAVEMDLEMKNMSAKTAFTSFNTVQSFAPIASTTTGSFSTKFKYKSNLNQNLEPDLQSINAEGSLTTLALIIQPEIMQKVADIMNDEKFKSLKFKDGFVDFKIENGRVNVRPIKMNLGDFPAEFSGSQGFDQTMDFVLRTNLPLDKIKIPKELQALNLTSGNLPVDFLIGGTYDNPTVKPNFGKHGGVKDAITNIVKGAVTEAKDSAVNVINKEAEKILADAAARAEAVINEAQKQADAIKAEGAKQAANIRAEAKKQGDKLIAEAGNNPLKLTAARAGADKLNSEADKSAKSVENEANKRADQVMDNARKERDKIMKEADDKAKIK